MIDHCVLRVAWAICYDYPPRRERPGSELAFSGLKQLLLEVVADIEPLLVVEPLRSSAFLCAYIANRPLVADLEAPTITAEAKIGLLRPNLRILEIHKCWVGVYLCDGIF